MKHQARCWRPADVGSKHDDIRIQAALRAFTCSGSQSGIAELLLHSFVPVQANVLLRTICPLRLVRITSIIHSHVPPFQSVVCWFKGGDVRGVPVPRLAPAPAKSGARRRVSQARSDSCPSSFAQFRAQLDSNVHLAQPTNQPTTQHRLRR